MTKKERDKLLIELRIIETYADTIADEIKTTGVLASRMTQDINHAKESLYNVLTTLWGVDNG